MVKGATPFQKTNFRIFMTEIIYSYGTLRPGSDDTVLIDGSLYDLGWFPGIKLGEPGKVVCEKITVNDISQTDAYEGYNPRYPDESLYIRKPFKDGWIYEYNGRVNPIKLIQSGDWLDYTREKRGVNGGRFS